MRTTETPKTPVLRRLSLKRLFLCGNSCDKLNANEKRSFYGHDERSRRMAQYTNPEHPEIIHAFPVLHPEYPESAAVIDEIIDWFRAHE